MAQPQKIGISRDEVLKRADSQKWVGLGSIAMSVSLQTHFLSTLLCSLSTPKPSEPEQQGEPSVGGSQSRHSPAGVFPAFSIGGFRNLRSLGRVSTCAPRPGWCALHDAHNCGYCCTDCCKLRRLFSVPLPSCLHELAWRLSGRVYVILH